MANFFYSARDSAGQLQEGRTEADTIAAVIDELRDRGWLVLEVRPDQPLSVGAALSELGPGNWLPIREVDIAIGFNQLSVMLRSGLTLLAALRAVSKHAPRRRLGKVWQRVAERIQEGASFAEALADHPCFPRLSIQLVRVGEQTGNLDRVLQRAARAIESQRELRRSLVSALLYPAIVIVMTIAVTAYMIFGLIPKLERFLSRLGRSLPPLTQTLLDISDFCRAYVVQGAILGHALLAGAMLLYTWPPGRLAMDAAALRVPIIGRALRLSATVLFARSLELLLSSGITLLEALRAIEQLLPNAHHADRVADARARVLQGSDLAGPLSETRAFESMLAQMIAVGEQSGNLEEVLEEAASFYEKELETLIKRLGVIIEPLIILIVGGIVGFVYVATFLALYAAV
jgi:type II secretory pathway component PulF